MLLSTTIFLFFLFVSYALFLLSSRKSDARQARICAPDVHPTYEMTAETTRN